MSHFTAPSGNSGARVSRWMIPAFIFAVAFSFRLAPLNRYVTPDEPVWVLRSIRFSQALSSRDPAAVPSTGHPGVTTMWLGSLGVQIHRLLAPEQAAAHLDWLDGLAGLSPKSPTAFSHLAFFLSGGRALIALTTSLGLVGIFVLAKRLWGLSVAVLAGFLLALDPFLAGHSGLLHLDGLLATWMTLSVLTGLLAIGPTHLSPARVPQTTPSPQETGRNRKNVNPYRWTLLSGLLAGLAVLTKTPAGVLVPFAGLLLIAAWITRRISLRQALIAMALNGLIAGLIFVILYPALWAEPLATCHDLLDVGGRHVEGALRPIFFHGQITYDPPPIFYPVVWLLRVSPLVLIGVPIALGVYLRHPGQRRFSIIALLALALGFAILVTLTAKKHDRYLLPAFPLLTLVAVLGWDRVGKLVKGKLIDRTAKINCPIPNLLVATVIFAQLLLTLPYLFAPLGYFNPLLGGPRVALKWLDVSWGEGEGAAARWLNQDSAAEHLIVASTSIPSFASLFNGETVLLDDHTRYQADYIVLPPLQGTEQLPFGLEAHPPVHEVQIGGISHASVIQNPAPFEQTAFFSDQARQDDLIILDARAALARLYEGPAHVVVLSDARDPTQVASRLADIIPGHKRLWYAALPFASPITARHIQQELVCYGRVTSSSTLAGMNVSQIALDNPQTCHAMHDTQNIARFDTLALTDTLLPDDPIAWPDHIPVVVRWEALAPLEADYRAILHLKDQAGHIWVEGGQEILDASYRRPSAWPPNHWDDQTFQVALPPAIPPGRYTVDLGIFDPVSGIGLSAWDASGEFAGLSISLGPVTIAPPPRPPSPWDVVISERFDPPLSAGPLLLLGHNPPPTQIASGDRVSFDIFWQATTAPDVNYTARWRLSLPEGGIALQGLAALSPYPTDHWRAQELQQVRYDLDISPDLEARQYNMTLNVLDTNGVPLWTEDVSLSQPEILARDRLFSLPSGIAYPFDMTLGSTIHWRGFDINALSARPGDKLSLTLYWQADGPTELSYTVFVHLVGPDGMIHGQVDRPPAQGAAPTHSWAPGQVIIDEISLPVWADAPVGPYYIALGLYEPISADRLPVYDAMGAKLPNDQIMLPIEVTIE